MELRTLGGSDLAITRIGIGTAPIGSLPGVWWVNWGHQAERDSVRAIHAAVEGGINWVDTAPFYGWGRAEEIVGRALRDHGDVLVFTKCGTMRREDGADYMDLRPETIRTDLEQSLRRLRRESVDLLQLHDVDRNVPVEETWGAIHELIREGKVRHGGISNHPPELVERALAVGPVAALQFEYSALQRREEERLLPFAREREIGVIVWAPLASGFLTDGFDLDALEDGDFRRTHPFAQRADLDEIRREVGGTAGALRFVLQHPAVSGAIVGIRNEREALDAVSAASASPRRSRRRRTSPDSA
jgi:aryl-alcohol dehydrogenase-like predicted oxidoreductase